MLDGASDRAGILTAEELETLSPTIRSFAEGAHMSITLESLLGSWLKFVEHVESGYPLEIDSYVNDVSVRSSLIEELLGVGSSSAVEKLQSIVAPLDERYIAATWEPEQEGRWPQTLVGRWFRIPKNLSGELREDLIKGGWISSGGSSSGSSSVDSGKGR